LCWSAAWQMCRDGEMAARDYVRLVLSGIASVTDMSVVQTLLRQASDAVRRFADPGWRETGLAMVADALRGLLHAAPPGSDSQHAGQRGGLAGDDGGRADHRHVPCGAGRLRRPGPVRAPAGLLPDVLRGRGGHLARVVVGDGARLRQRRLPGMPDLAGDGPGD